jgi:hypothetical protein
MVKRTFFSLSVFLGSMAGVFLCHHAKSDDQHGSTAATASACEAWSYGYEGCWYDDTSDFCPYDTVEAEPTLASADEQVAETHGAEQDAYESRYSKFSGYDWEYDDYDSAYDDDTWLEPIADVQADAVVETQAAVADEPASTTAGDDTSDWMAEEYDYWSEYRYDNEFRYYESTAQATLEATPAVCPASEPSAVADDVEVVQAWDDDAVTEAVVETQADADDANEYDYDYDCDYSHYYYGYGDFESSQTTENADTSEPSMDVIESTVEEASEADAIPSSPPRNAAILTLAHSLDRLGSALQVLSRQLTDMATPEVAARGGATGSKQH